MNWLIFIIFIWPVALVVGIFGIFAKAIRDNNNIEFLNDKKVVRINEVLPGGFFVNNSREFKRGMFIDHPNSSKFQIGDVILVEKKNHQWGIVD